MTIVSIRGTHGSGKSTIVQKILRHWPSDPIWPDVPQGRVPKPAGYTVITPKSTIFVVGPYHTQCGGCDAVQPYSDILARITYGVAQGWDVLLEGALVSSSYGTVGELMNAYAPNAYFAFLDTPLDKCLDRIRQRREMKGNLEPVNPHNTTVKHDNVARTKDQMVRLGSKVKVVDINHLHPVTDVMKLFGVTLRKEPA